MNSLYSLLIILSLLVNYNNAGGAAKGGGNSNKATNPPKGGGGGKPQPASGNNNAKDYAALQLDTWRSQNNPVNVLTASNGMPVPSLTDSLTVGPRGPTLLQDFVLLDNLFTFDRERIPERVVHAVGAAAFGEFVVTNDVTKYTKMDMLKKINQTTPVFVRFSTVGGRAGSADTARDPRGFAVKFYTEVGNWDLVGNNLPVFFINDAIKFPAFVHTQKLNPQTNLADATMTWDFLSLNQESMNMIMRVFSDLGTPDGFRKMDGFGVHAFVLVNAKDEKVYCKFHWISQQGHANLTADQATLLAGTNPGYSTGDLYNAIARGDFPKWDLKIQVMTDQQAAKLPFNPVDPTKIWSQKDFPLIDVGTMTLNRNPENYFRDVEQAAFDPARMVEGVLPSTDKLLQGRLFSYQDTQFYRLGANHMLLPVNCPYKFRYANVQRDGAVRLDKNGGGSPNYFPNSFGGYRIAGVQSSWNVENSTVGRYKQAEDYFVQPAEYWNELSPVDRQHLAENIAGSLGNALQEVQDRMIPLFTKVNPAFGSMVKTEIAKLKGKNKQTQPPPCKGN
uniref:Catalase n=1 Tax=Meloidogyne incognita TaxID=6306 RepID=A0A914KGG9_MELIC